MLQQRISDWDDAYANGPNIPKGELWPQRWEEPAQAYRDALAAEGRARLDIRYGERPRNSFHLFIPASAPKGLVVFVLGGFWLRLHKDLWSHLAAGANARGYAVAMPGYTLCPDVRVSDITREVGAAVAAAAALVDGPIHLTGHSAGGHLATRMVCKDTPLAEPLRARIGNVVSIAGVHDLRPMMRTALNETLKLDAAEAAAESPALLEPLDGVRLTCWVGAGERSEFIRQSALLANVWKGLGAATLAVEEPDRHHFNVVNGLADAGHPLTRLLVGE